MGLNETALILYVALPFIYMFIACAYKNEITLNREQRRKKTKMKG